MTPQIVAVLAILAAAVALFATERLRVDLVAVLVLVALAASGLLTTEEALSGFSNPAVVTVWAVLVLGAGLARTGVAGLVGSQVLRLAGSGEARLVAIIMLAAALLSSVMNSVGVAALMLPTVIDIAARTGRSPSRLLMPLAFATLLGGMNTLIGTPTNILVAEVMREHGLRPFAMFDFVPAGLPITLVGIAYMAAVGRRWLDRPGSSLPPARRSVELGALFELRERLYSLRVPGDSALVGCQVGRSGLGAMLELTLIGIERSDGDSLVPDMATTLRPGDRLLVQGRIDRLQKLHVGGGLLAAHDLPEARQWLCDGARQIEALVPVGSTLVGSAVPVSDLRNAFAVAVLAVRRDDVVLVTGLDDLLLEAGDALVLHGSPQAIAQVQGHSGLVPGRIDRTCSFDLGPNLLAARVPHGSPLIDQAIGESRLADAYGLTVLGLGRSGAVHRLPAPTEPLAAGDVLLLQGRGEDLLAATALHTLVLEAVEIDPAGLESEDATLIEAVLSPHSTLSGKTPRDVRFRERYGLSVLAIWRAGRAYRGGIRDRELHFGDALLLFGPRERARLLVDDPEFVVLDRPAPPPRRGKAALASLIMIVALALAMGGWLPMAVAVIAGMAAMVLTGCLTMDEAYQAIEWKAIFLIAGMLPLGLALERTGAAQWLATGLIVTLGRCGPPAVTAGLCAVTMLASQIMPNPAVAVLLAPIALWAASEMGVSPYPLAMAVAVSSSAAFLGPVGHASNLMVMGPGGYRLGDYVRVGAPMAGLVLLVAVLVIPLVWPY